VTFIAISASLLRSGIGTREISDPPLASAELRPRELAAMGPVASHLVLSMVFRESVR
jgi:hypothetical protein